MPERRIKRVFIAKRGEIAVRVIRACRVPGLECARGVSAEEAPASRLQMPTHRTLREAALAVVREIRYASTGAIEFLLERVLEHRSTPA